METSHLARHSCSFSLKQFYRAGELSKTEAQLKIEGFWAGRLRRAILDGEFGSLMAGQSVEFEESVAEIVGDLCGKVEATALAL